MFVAFRAFCGFIRKEPAGEQTTEDAEKHGRGKDDLVFFPSAVIVL